MMTTIAMIFGMLCSPSVWARAPSQRAPMARAVIGGLITSTMLTLFVVPVVLVYIDRVGAWSRKRFSRSADDLARTHKPAE